MVENNEKAPQFLVDTFFSSFNTVIFVTCIFFDEYRTDEHRRMDVLCGAPGAHGGAGAARLPRRRRLPQRSVGVGVGVATGRLGSAAGGVAGGPPAAAGGPGVAGAGRGDADGRRRGAGRRPRRRRRLRRPRARRRRRPPPFRRPGQQYGRRPRPGPISIKIGFAFILVLTVLVSILYWSMSFNS